MAAITYDYSAVQDVSSAPLTKAQAATFRDWIKNTLYEGAAWFSASWSLPSGARDGIRKFAEPITWTFVPGGYWTWKGKVEVRGRGMQPTNCYNVAFDAVTDLITISGNAGLFATTTSIYGNTLDVASQSAVAVAEVKKLIDGFSDVTSISFKTKIGAANSDDACVINFYHGVTSQFSCNPYRETSFDAFRRPRVYMLGGSEQVISPTALVIGVWYQIDLTLVAGSGNSYVTLTRLDTNVVVATTLLTGSFTTLNVDNLHFYDDSGGQTCPTQYADVHIC
jgi:hypothetical protein